MTTRLMDNLSDGPMDSLLDQFGESIVYAPYGGSARTISAIVRRAVPEPVPGVSSGRLSATVLTITVWNDTTSGIGNAEISAHGDTVTVAVREGDTPRALPILQIIKQTPAWQTFEVRGSGKTGS